MTPEQGEELLRTALLSGCRPSDQWTQLGGIRKAAPIYAAALSIAGVDADTAAMALVRYINLPNGDGFPKMLPDPGAIIAQTPGSRQRAASLATADSLFDRLCRAVGSLGDYRRDDEYPASMGYDPTSPEAQALIVASKAVGGWYGIGQMNDRDKDTTRRTWAAMFRSALDAAPINHARPMIPGPGPTARLATAS